jgi:DNA-binding transcriptional LysR family regulator
LDALEFRRIDLGIIRPTKPSTSIATHPISREAMVLAVNSGHRLAKANKVKVKDLEGEPFIMYSPVEGRYFHDMLLAMFQTAGVAPQFVQHVSQDHTVLSLVRANLGIAIVPRSAVQLAFPSVEFLDISLSPAVGAELYAAYRADNKEPVMRRVLELIGQLHFA